RDQILNDLNTTKSVEDLIEHTNKVNRTHSTALARQLRALGRVLGLLARESEDFLRAGTGDEISEAQIGALIAERNEARRAKNFRRADEIRDELFQRGIGLEDDPRGTTWRRV